MSVGGQCKRPLVLSPLTEISCRGALHCIAFTYLLLLQGGGTRYYFLCSFTTLQQFRLLLKIGALMQQIQDLWGQRIYYKIADFR